MLLLLISETVSLVAAAAEEISDNKSEESPVRMCQCGPQRDHFLSFSKAGSVLGKIIINFPISDASQEVQSANDTG